MANPTLTFGLIGASIGRSLAPRLYAHLGQTHGLSVRYLLQDAHGVPSYNPVDVARGCAAEGYRGVNVTHPFKRAFSTYVHIADAAIARLGSVNCVRFDSSAWEATNTDYTGFLRAYRQRFGDMRPGRVILLGAGGVGKSIAHGLAKLGAEWVGIHDSIDAAGHALAEELTRYGHTAQAVSAAALPDAVRSATGLVNCTPVGMVHHPGNPFPAGTLSGQSWAFDAIYTPTMTPFLQSATDAGLQTMTGFELFLFQGLDGFQFFTGLETPESLARPAAEQWLRETH